MNDCYIVCAADMAPARFTPGAGDYIIAADAGCRHLERLGARPDLIVGDFDSLGRIPSFPNVEVCPVEKDDTDSMIALRHAVTLGCRRILLFGALGGRRLDHTLANIQALAWARAQGAELIPVDSEHSAIFQCLAGRERELEKILLTGSGGPFRGKTRGETSSVTPEQALRHPNWSMGPKITVDSATMMNKGLEFIEAMHLFGVTPDDIEVLIHPESVVHSAVELVDGTVIAQFGVADMRLPIQYALTWPERRGSSCKRLELTELSGLHFMKPQLENTPCLALAMECARRGGNSAAVMNAANEEAVHLFLKRRLGYNEIYDCVAEAVAGIGFIEEPGLEDIIESDGEARRFVKERYT